MINYYIAKTKPKETIMEHTDNLIKQFQKLKKLYPNINYVDWDMLKIACLYHDLGKMNTKFQLKLMSKLEMKNDLKDDFPDIEEIPHGYLSPAFLPYKELKEKYNIDQIRILYQSIYYHHNRKSLNNSEELQKIIQYDLSKYVKDFKYGKIRKLRKLYKNYVRFVIGNARIPNDDKDEIVYQYIMTKGLLNKIDFAASASINIEEKNTNLYEKTLAYLKKDNHEPNELQEYLIDNQDKSNIIVASTGIGKTEAALFWIGNNKGFFTLPLKVSINAIYDRVVGKIRFLKKKTGLLHSDTSSEYIKRDKENKFDIEYYDKTRQLSLPLTVCTLDQLIDFVFMYEGYELKLATLAYSKLIIDEIQMYNPELVAYLIIALHKIIQLGGKFTIVTATFPPVFEYFMEKLKIDFNKPQPFYKKVNGKVQLRHKIEILEEDINTELIKNNCMDKKVLIIVNTVYKAQEIYDKLKIQLKGKLQYDKINLLHSKFIKKDRTIKEDQIFEMGKLENKDTGIWIATQVVEASLDIDFDVLYTELSDICGLLQRMGRVYRNRELKDGHINVYIYIGNKKRTSGINTSNKSVIDSDIFDLSKKAIKNYNMQELDEEKKMKLVEEVYSVKNLKDKKYFDKILETIKTIQYIKPYEVHKSDISLREIETRVVIPESIFIKNKSFINDNIEVMNNSKEYSEKLIAKNNIKNITLSIQGYEYQWAIKNLFVNTEKVKLDDYNEIPVIRFNYTYEKGLEKPKNVKSFDDEDQII
ncbi:CRISPR-associated helicase Cas3' [Clostridium fermenticellae]|uniref:CRISPR-associated helicase Cas3 n=1 Tax=Clostridium fermenticellae TaxID=2068654 RepID=A0A386H3E5_9CLOT|nr:CRISPR-associated helicase Cas3' [Clostridium fermenticellae]AYD40186.1 CRISPR-associated helicase Cas3' [Clostridium fermenticellae]